MPEPLQIQVIADQLVLSGVAGVFELDFGSVIPDGHRAALVVVELVLVFLAALAWSHERVVRATQR